MVCVKNKVEREFNAAVEIAIKTALSKINHSSQTLSSAYVFSSLNDADYNIFWTEKLEEINRLLKMFLTQL